ncbi:RNA polymerase subunit sigma-70 [Thermohalobacter berrensis]|uniref:RNA polymerase subunit sigma-70 n=1 Tax=Thermohalobacter berrensis TaxID=99594 RepID=A0A419T549_9FIRM|nr:RNA polymerase subunit sigma-70 [Thermohalobacter berrensis]
MDEEKIVEELKKGNMNVFSQLVDIYKNRIFAVAYKFTNNYTDTQDLAQEIFLKIYNEIDKFRYDCKLSTWIYKIATNMCIDWKKRHKKRNFVGYNSLNDSRKNNLILNIKDKEPLTEEKVMCKYDQYKIHQAIFNLPNIYKTVIVMYHFYNMSYNEIAKALEVSVKTVETRLYRGRKKLKEELVKNVGGGDFEWNVKK